MMLIILLILSLISLSYQKALEYERIQKDCSYYCTQGGCLFNKCSDIQCPGGIILFIIFTLINLL